ncbi:MAG: hypothetical protein ACRCVT_03255 [Leadbetterella sp.]
MKHPFPLIILFLTVITTHFCYGQGCSDAGFCTVNGIKPSQGSRESKTSNEIKVGAFSGLADNNIMVNGAYLNYYRKVNQRLGLDFKITSLGQNGNDISVFGLSDVFINTNYKIKQNLSITVGTKIPLSDGNNTLEGKPLPMDYQPSLGTIDLTLGLGYQIKKLHIVAAIQQPITQNKNQFTPKNVPPYEILTSIISTKQFIRSGDILNRLSYPIINGNKFRITPSILSIYHISTDKYYDELNVKREIEGSNGLTVNGTLFLDYRINTNNTLQLNVGMPFLIREARPDGLTRGFVANLEYKIEF